MRLARRHLGHLDGEHRLDLRLLIWCEGETEALLDNLILHPIEALAHIVAAKALHFGGQWRRCDSHVKRFGN